jgi:putative transposase|tara:strand:+ start:231 stop:500 length:270 start_codon:yes stop_codon:yes gene_type:complete
MARKRRHSEEEILRILKEGESGLPVAEVLRKHGICQGTYYRWKSAYGGMETNQLKRLRALERENSELKKIVAEQTLDIRILKDVNSKNW